MKLLIVQPYLASYRLPFWREVVPRLRAKGIVSDIAFGSPGNGQDVRGDHETLPNAIPLANGSYRILGSEIRWQHSWRLWRNYDGLVLEASGSLLDTSLALLGDRRVALWGHIDSFTGPGHPVDRWIEGWQLRRARSVLAYTGRGRREAVAQGVDADRVFELKNTIDTSALLTQMALMTRDQADHLLGTHGWKRTKTFSYIGGIDQPKRIDFLVASLDIIWERDPSIRVLVAGRGDQEYLLRPAVRRGQVRLLGRAAEVEKAALARVSAAILMPGRVGLVAVDSLAMGLPIVTTNFPFHAPEFEYLTPDRDCVVAPNDSRLYAETVLTLSADEASQSFLQNNAMAKAGWPRIEDMVQLFTDGCVRLFND